jgi:hypothetical protein
MNNITPERLSEIEKRCNAAPETVEYKTVGRSYNTHQELDDDCKEFYYAARTDIPDLLSEIKRLREELDQSVGKLEYANELAFEARAKRNGMAAQLSDAQAALKVSNDAIQAFIDHRSRVFDAQMLGKKLPDGIGDRIKQLEDAIQ